MRKTLLTGLGGVAAAFLGSLCCVGPLLFVTLGVGAGLASTFEPLRPLFGALMLGLLGAGFWAVYARRGAPAMPVTMPVTTPAQGGDTAGSTDGDPGCGPAIACAVPTRRGRDVAILWSATILALVLWTFPTWSRWLV